MKDFIKFCFAIACGIFILYAAYLVYIKFFTDSDEEDDLCDDGEEISFSARVKKAAQKQLEKIG